ncbi:unnamed protein product, partial [Sphagnum troendelagicum]
NLVLPTSCSLLHTAVDLKNETKLDAELKSWLAFTAQNISLLPMLRHMLPGGLLQGCTTGLFKRLITEQDYEKAIKAGIDSVVKLQEERDIDVLIHTHMCYSNFSDIIHSIIDMDAVVITIEDSQSDEKLLSVFREGVVFGAGIGPGVYDIHSPRIPSTEEMAERARKMLAVLESKVLWINPDCGLETRKYAEVVPALTNMVNAAKQLWTELAK